ncbi:hypothetical protein G6F57_019155 [Rhizopus arrhizus]|nr:hypothetical protein G6F23_013655 [Rhizopus arrhizus]KAG1440088.1 hypothetical protein G6F57_019155 [Rhizopus arrhizus]
MCAASSAQWLHDPGSGSVQASGHKPVRQGRARPTLRWRPMHDPLSASSQNRPAHRARHAGPADGGRMRVHGAALQPPCPTRAGRLRCAGGPPRRTVRVAHPLADVLLRSRATGIDRYRAGQQPRSAHGVGACARSARPVRHPARRSVSYRGSAGRRHPRPRAGRPEPDGPAPSQQPVSGGFGAGQLGAGLLGPRAQPEGRRAAELPGY